MLFCTFWKGCPRGIYEDGNQARGCPPPTRAYKKMDYRKTYEGIKAYQKNSPQSVSVYEDGLTLLRRWYESTKEVHPSMEIADFRVICARGMKVFASAHDYNSAEKLRDIIYQLYKLEARDSFDAFCLALEYDRPVEQQFYYPRRNILRPYVDDLQKLADGEIEELFMSCPPRVGKTTLVMFFLLWMIGKDSEKSNLYCSYSGTITSAFYEGVLEILTDKDTYKWTDIFEGHDIAKNGTDALDTTINVDRNKKYASLTCRSLYGTLNGACDCNGIMIGDDLLSGIEEAMSKDRLSKAWSLVSNNLLSRTKQGAKKLWIGTRWSIYDPIGVRLDMVENDDNFRDVKYKVINVPALDENDESNWDYKFGVGYNTSKFKQIRAGFERDGDIASWNAQYMGRPIEREGALFEPSDMRYYNGVLPDEEPDRIFMPVDPAYGGGDYVASPLCVQYEDDIYVPCVVFSNADKTITQPALASMAKTYDASITQVEANKSTMGYAEGLEEAMRAIGCATTVVTKPANNQKSKEQGIFDKAPDIRKHFIFLQSGKRSKEYELFMQNVFSFKITGKNKHDDAPDSLKMAAEMAFKPYTNNIRIFRRRF